jgi:hypothetical protein
MHESQALFHSIHVPSREYMCTVMSDLRCSTHGGSKATELQMIQALAWNALGKPPPLRVATLSGTRGTDKPTLNTLQLVQSSMQLL